MLEKYYVLYLNRGQVVLFEFDSAQLASDYIRLLTESQSTYKFLAFIRGHKVLASSELEQLPRPQ